MSKLNNCGSRSVSSASCSSVLSEGEEVTINDNEDSSVNKVCRLLSCSKSQKAKRVRFYHNGNKYFTGVLVPVTSDRYRSFESLITELTNILTKYVTLPCGVRAIYSTSGQKVCCLEDLEDGKDYVCCSKGESFKQIEYSSNRSVSGKVKKLNNMKIYLAPPKIVQPTCVRPRIITIIRNGLKPRKVIRLLLNKRNASSMEQVLSALTDAAQLDSGAVRKVFTLSGQLVIKLEQFFDSEDVFFVYGNERYSQENFELDFEESKVIQKLKKPPSSRNGIASKVKITRKNQLNRINNENNSDLNNYINNLLEVADPNNYLPPNIKQKYTAGFIIGDGNFALVRLITDKQTTKMYALKIIDKHKCNGKEDMIDNEVRILKKLNHPNIMKLIEDEETKDSLYLVCEYVDGGDLFDAITKEQKFSEDQAALMVKHLSSALAYLHNLNIVHRDVKPENLLVRKENGQVVLLKLGDFGLACEVTGPLYTVCGTPTYVAPEILTEAGYGLKIDIWAAGVILYVLLCGYPPFVSENNDQEKLFDCILSGQYDFPDEYWQDISYEAKELINNMLQLDPELRFSAEDILDYPWLTLADKYDN